MTSAAGAPPPGSAGVGVGRSEPGIVVQARMGSTRLPGKVLMDLAGAPMLARILDRLTRSRLARRIVVATTEKGADDAVAEEAARRGAIVFRGSEEDVLARYAGAARAAGCDPVVRVTADCPLIDPEILDQALALFLERRSSGRPADVVTNTREGARTYPRGLDVEVVSRAALERAHAEAAPAAPEREHVTLWIYRHADRYAIDDLRFPDDLSSLRWTVDTPEDLAFARAVYEALLPEAPLFLMRDVLALLGRNPALAAINSHIEQRSP